MVYEACHPATPRDVDTWENWEIASYLGAGRGEKIGGDPAEPTAGPRPTQLPPGVDLIAERMRAEAEGRRLDAQSLRNP